MINHTGVRVKGIKLVGQGFHKVIGLDDMSNR
jgi:hypothetical protein